MARWREAIEDIVIIYVLVLAVLLVIGGLLLSLSTCFVSLISTVAGGAIIWAALRQQNWLKPPPDPKFAYYYPYTRRFPYLPPDKIEKFRVHVKKFYRKFNIPPVKILLPVFLFSILVGSLALLTIETQFGIFAWIPFIFVFIIAFSFPSLIWISLVYNKDSFTPEPARNIMIVLTWGMLSVVPALIGNTLLGIAFFSIGLSAAVVSFMVATFSAPFVEELSKPLGLSFVRFDINTKLDGLIYGVTAGMGFAMIENLSYEIGTLLGPFIEVNLELGLTENAPANASSAFALITLARGLGSTVVHAIGAGMIGMAFYTYRNTPGRPLLPLAGAYGFAVMVHMTWNGVLSTIELYGLGDLVALPFLIGFPILMLFIMLHMIKICKSEEPELKTADLRKGKDMDFDLPDIPQPPHYPYPYYQYPAPAYPAYPSYPPPQPYPYYYPPPPPPSPPPPSPYYPPPPKKSKSVGEGKSKQDKDKARDPGPGAKSTPRPKSSEKVGEDEDKLVRCPRCDKTSRIPPMVYGNEMICPHCGMLFRHPY